MRVTVIIIIIIICVLRVIGIKPFVCLLCNTTFTRQHSLKYHMLFTRISTASPARSVDACLDIPVTIRSVVI